MKSLSSTNDEIIDFIRDNFNSCNLTENILRENLLHTGLMYVTGKFYNIVTTHINGLIYNRIRVKLIKLKILF
jgi:hypothetical protein